jgi:hypothetical protein
MLGLCTFVLANYSTRYDVSIEHAGFTITKCYIIELYYQAVHRLVIL